MPLVDAHHRVRLNNTGDKEKVNATKNANKSSFFISLAIRYVVNMAKIPTHVPTRNIVHSIPKSVHWDTPERIYGIALGYEYGYNPKMESGLIIHFA